MPEPGRGSPSWEAAGDFLSKKMPGRIRIAHLVYRFDCGGLQNGMVNIINGLPADEFEHTIISLTDSTEFRRRLPENVRIEELNKRPGKSPAYLYRVWTMLRSGRYDILHTRNLPCLEGQLAGVLAGIPVRIHGEHGWDIFDLQGTRKAYRLLRRVFRPLITRYVVVSRQLEDFLAESIGINRGRITRICNGVDAEKFRPAAAAVAAQPLVIGSVGRIEAVKDYMTLARAFASVTAACPGSARLVLIGDGSERSGVESFLRRAGVAGQCDLLGARDDVAEQMRQFGVFVLPSRAEGISNTILEAMASGLPVVATSVGGNSELVVNGVTGFLVPPSDPDALAARLRYYVDHPEAIRLHGQAGRERVLREFSLDVMVGRYRALYTTCTAAAATPGAEA